MLVFSGNAVFTISPRVPSQYDIPARWNMKLSISPSSLGVAKLTIQSASLLVFFRVYIPSMVLGSLTNCDIPSVNVGKRGITAGKQVVMKVNIKSGFGVLSREFFLMLPRHWP